MLNNKTQKEEKRGKKMPIRRKTGGSFDFVAPHNELEPLENQLGRHAKIGPSRHEKSMPVFEANFEKQTLERKFKPSLIQRIKRFFGKV